MPVKALSEAGGSLWPARYAIIGMYKYIDQQQREHHTSLQHYIACYSITARIMGFSSVKGFPWHGFGQADSLRGDLTGMHPFLIAIDLLDVPKNVSHICVCQHVMPRLEASKSCYITEGPCSARPSSCGIHWQLHQHRSNIMLCSLLYSALITLLPTCSE